MKRFILFLSVFFFAFSSSNINAQTIDSLVVTQFIECPGDEGSFEVFITQTNPLTNYNIVVQMADPQNNFQTHVQGQWLLNTTNTTHIFSNLIAGFYRVLLVDPACSPPYPTAFNLPPDTCIFSSFLMNLSNPLPLDFELNPGSLDCWNDTVADFEVNNITGLTQPYTLTLLDAVTLVVISGPVTLGPTDVNYVFTGLSAGDYIVSAIDFFNCQPAHQEQDSITSNDTIVPIISIDIPISCFDADDGQITASASGGTPPYNFTWASSNGYVFVDNGVLSSTAVGLAPGDYWCTIIDDVGCDTITDTVTLTNPPSLTAIVDTLGSNACNGDCDVVISVSIGSPGSGPPYLYSNGGPFGPSPTFSNQCAGSYTIQVQDANGCPSNTVTPDPVVITEPDPITVYVSADSASCFGVCDAEITIDSVTGGNITSGTGTSLPYLDLVAFSPPLVITSDTCAGSYTYAVTDDLGCAGTGLITAFQPDTFFIAATILTNVSCPGDCDGTVDITPTNGIGSIDYYYETSLTTTSVDSVCGFNTSGYANFFGIDANGCEAEDSVSLSEPDLFVWSMDSVNENCALGNGQASINITQGGTPPYVYSWSGPFGNNAVAPSTNIQGNTDIISLLQYGWYVVEVIDNLGCSPEIDSVLVDTASIILDVSVIVPCNDSSGNIILNSVNSQVLTSIVWVDNYNNFLTGTYLQTNSNFLTDTLTTLIPGIYWYEVQLTGCDPVRDSVVVGPGVTMNASLDVLNSDLNLDCFGDMTESIIIHVVDGFNSIPNSPNNNSFNAYTVIPTYNVAISDAPLGDNNFLQSGGMLPAGNYDIVITPNMFDPFGNPIFTNCMDTVPVTVTEPDSLEFSLDSVQTLCFGDSTGIIFVDTIFGGNSGQYNYTWTDNTGNIISTSDSINGLPAGWYYLSVTDSLNCLPAAIDSIEITSPTEISWTTTVTAIDSCEYTSPVGSIVLTSAGGMGLHSYIWNGLDANGNPFNTTTQNISTLTSGWYYITITDTNSCTKNDSVFIENGQNPALDSSSFTNVSCAGAHDGSYIAIVDSITGSLSFPYTFWNFSSTPPNWEPGYIPSESSLGPEDTVYIRLKDNFGCVDSSSYVITEPDTLIIQRVTPSVYPGGWNVTCWDSLTATINIDSVTGGTMPYYYSINGLYNPDSTVHFFDTLAAAWYYCDVIDANGCTYRDSVTLTQPDSLSIDSFTTSAYIGGWGVSCNGFNDGSATVHVSGGTFDSITFFYTYGWSNGDSLIFTDTLSGNTWYTVNVTDTNGCHRLSSVYISEPSPLVIDSITTVDVLCNAESSDWVQDDRGEATVFVSGATPNYYYLWNNEDTISPTYANPNDTVGSNNDITATADTLRAGWYTVEIWDENGCYTTDSVEIFEPSISVEIDTLIVTQMTCANWNNANVDIVALGPILYLPYYYYVYDEFNPADTASQGNLGFNAGLSEGHYVAMVEDTRGCLDRDTFEIYHLDSVRIDSIITINISCNGYNDGYIHDIFPSGGTPPYTYSVDGGPEYSSWICNILNPGCTNINGTGYVFTGLTPGEHTVEIWDSNRCANSIKIIITEPEPIQFAISTNSYNNYLIECNGDPDSAFIVVSGGDAPYDITYTVGPGGMVSTTITTFNSDTMTGIYAGAQTFEILDQNGCMVDTTILFTQPDLIDTVSSIINRIFCRDSCNGSITAIISGGVGMGIGTNYTYQWYYGPDIDIDSIITGETSYTITNLCARIYTLEVNNISPDNDCPADFTWDLNSTLLQININATAFSIINASCFETSCDGSISVVVNGGVPSPSGSPYTYLWDDPLLQTQPTAIGLCEGTYICIVTDADGCEDSASFTVTEPSELVAGITVAPGGEIDCNGNSTGSLQSTTTQGGTLPYTYLWSNGSTAASINGLSAGQYSLFITDANGCTNTAWYTLGEPSELVIVYDGSNTDSVWVTDVNCFNGCDGSIKVAATGGTPCGGIPPTYDYYLYDASGILVATLTNSASATFNGLCTGIYTVKVTDCNGCSYTTSDIFVDEPLEALSLVIDASDGTCTTSASVMAYVLGGTENNCTLGYTYVWSNSTGGPAGVTDPNNDSTSVFADGYTDYYLTVTDCNGCSISGSASVRDYDNIFLPDYSDSYDTTICLGGQLNINVAECDGCTYIWTRSNGDIIAITASLSITPDISWSPIEILTLGITDNNGCTVTDTAVIYIDSLIPACSASTLTTIKGESVILTSNSSFATYEWTNSSGEVISQNNEHIINPEKSDCYYLYVEDGVCKGYCSLCVFVGSSPYDAFSPNGDGYNDYWVIKDITSFIGATVQIFNRWGALIFEATNCPTACWDGMIDGKDAPMGTYYYSIDHNDGSEVLQGTITLVR